MSLLVGEDPIRRASSDALFIISNRTTRMMSGESGGLVIFET